MAISITALQSLNDVSDLSIYSSSSYTPNASRLLLAYIVSRHATAAAAPRAIRIITLSSVSYTSAVASDIGKSVSASTQGALGNLLDYNNTTRTWYVDTTTDITPDGQTISIPTGTGSGTHTADAAGVGVTGNGVTWSLVKSVVDASGIMRISLYAAYSGASPTTSVMTTTYAGAQTGQHMSIVEVNGADLTRATADLAIAQSPTGTAATGTSLSITIAALSGGLNRFFSGFCHAGNEVTTPRAFVAGTSLTWTEIHDLAFATPVSGFETQKLETDQELAASASWATSSVNVGIAAEIIAALTVTTDLTLYTNAETITGWTNVGAAGTGVLAIEPDYCLQGTQCVSRGFTTTSAVLRGGVFGGTTLNFGTAGSQYGMLIYVWVRMTAQQTLDTRANGGIQIVIGSTSAPSASGTAYGSTPTSAWYVGGSDYLPDEDGWACFVIDPTLPPSTISGTGGPGTGGADLTAVGWIGATAKIIANASSKGQTFAIDAIRYGLGEIKCNGSITGVGFKTMSDADFGTKFNKWGIIQEKAGAFLIKGKVVIGDSVATAATTFSSLDEALIWQYPTYYDGTRERTTIRQLNPNTGLPYFGLDFRGNGTGNTNITFGAKVGTGNTASGRSGPSFTGSRIKTAFDFDDGSVETTLIYGTTFRDIRGGIDMSANASTDEFIGNNVVKCGSFQTGPVKIRGCNFIDNYGGAYRFLEDFKNDGNTVQQLSTADPSRDWTDRLNGSNWSIPVGTEYVELLDPGASDRREVSQVNPPDTGAGITITVAAGPPGTFTRSAGNFLTDGFTVGMTIVTSGFANGANSGTFTIRNLTATIITVADTLTVEAGGGDERIKANPFETANSGDHYAEAIINWPSAGASQGALGVCIRMAWGAGAAENYYYLKCDIVAQTITLIRTDAGSDTTVDGPDSFTFAEDTDYLVHLIGRGTLIEGFVNGQKVTVTSSTYQTNLGVGIRGDAEADQTGDAPRLKRFGAGPITNALGSIVLASANDDSSYNAYINNARAYDLTTTGSYDFTSDSVSGNAVDLRDDSSGATTVNITTGSSPTVLEEVDDAVTSVVVSVGIAVTVKDENTDPIEGAQVYIQKSQTTPPKQWNYTIDTAGGTVSQDGQGAIVVNETVDTDLPQSGWVFVWHKVDNTKQNYRYSSWSSKTFTFPTEVTGTANTGGSSTTLKRKTGTSFLTADIEEGDTVRNTTDVSWAVVDEIVDADTITTTPLSSGSWDEDDGYSFHKLAIDYTEGDDLADIPIFNGQTDANGEISTTYAGTSLAILVRIRSNNGTPKYVPFQTSGDITATGYSLTAILTTDTVAT